MCASRQPADHVLAGRHCREVWRTRTRVEGCTCVLQTQPANHVTAWRHCRIVWHPRTRGATSPTCCSPRSSGPAEVQPPPISPASSAAQSQNSGPARPSYRMPCGSTARLHLVGEAVQDRSTCHSSWSARIGLWPTSETRLAYVLVDVLSRLPTPRRKGCQPPSYADLRLAHSPASNPWNPSQTTQLSTARFCPASICRGLCKQLEALPLACAHLQHGSVLLKRLASFREVSELLSVRSWPPRARPVAGQISHQSNCIGFGTKLFVRTDCCEQTQHRQDQDAAV